jgi:gliding motility-associated-like protein
LVFSYRLYGLIILLFFSCSEIKAQVCTGALGIPILSNTFGSGPTKFANAYPPTSGIGFQYIAGTPEARQYTLVKNNFDMNNREDGWFQIIDHTDETSEGYMMIANGDETTRSIFQVRHNTLCPNTTYEFSMYVLNLFMIDGVDPNITFSVETPDGTVVKTFNTGDIPESTEPTWLKEAVSFNTGVYTDLIIKIISNGVAGDGNDFAVDDMALRACGPAINSTLNGSSNLTREACYGDNPTLTFAADVLAGFNDPVFQWEISTGGIAENNWTNYTGPGATTKSITVSYTNANIGRYIYRLLVAERASIGSPICRVISEMYIVNINKLPEVLSLTTIGSTCEGGNMTLTAEIGSEVIEDYQWTGPNGFTSTLKSPVLQNLTQVNSGTYSVLVTNNHHCVSSAQTTIVVSPAIEGGINITSSEICLNESVSLIATGGTTYNWFPVDGLSDPTIANPIATPNQTTEYTVTISNGNCSVEKTVMITVLQNVVANAGKDKNVLKGRSVILNGSSIGFNIKKFYWTPTDYLDDPTKINPIATPPKAITYTLHVESDCNTSTDDVSVEVFPNIEVPNSFTPNGDGINDTWNIPSIVTFSNPRLIVVNRYGRTVFESYNNTPWDGKSRGKDLPSGAYFYTLYINRDYKIYAGWVFITR